MRAAKSILTAAFIVVLGCTTRTDSGTLLLRDGDSVVSKNQTAYRVAGPRGFYLVGPMEADKVEDNGWKFDVEAAYFVSADAVVSVAAERLKTDDAKLDYSNLDQSQWPSPEFHVLSDTCMALTPEQANLLPPETGIVRIIEAGFIPDGSFAVASAITASVDGRDEISIETISRVQNCEDKEMAHAAIDALRSRITVERK